TSPFFLISQVDLVPFPLWKNQIPTSPLQTSWKFPHYKDSLCYLHGYAALLLRAGMYHFRYPAQSDDKLLEKALLLTPRYLQPPHLTNTHRSDHPKYAPILQYDPP